MNETTATETISITMTVTRGRLTIEDARGNRGFGVVVDGPIRGRELMWMERADGTTRVMPATEWRNFVGE